MKILIADDEKDLCRALAVILEHAHYLTDTVHDGEEALYYALNGHYDAMILDIMMPKLDGVEVIKALRSRGSSLPVLMLTAKDQLDDKVTGLRAGADDYLSKPFETEELLARLEALLRRPRVFQPENESYAGLLLDRERGALLYEDGYEELTNKEFLLMELFIRYPERVFSKEHLLDRVWGEEREVSGNLLWTNISSLRRKLEALGAPFEIRNQRGLGYSLRRPEDGT